VANNVRESGDDMIAVVSYLGAGDASLLAPAQVAATIDVRRRRELVRDVLISGNDVAAPYWGRGISVVGGEDIGIVDNRIDASTHGAAIYIAREAGYATFGVRNVRVERNHITRVQTTRPAYSVLPLPARLARTGHGAIELVAHQFSDEAAIARLREALTVEGVLVAANRIEDAGVPGVRIGYGWNQVFSQVRALPDGRVAQRRFGGARVSTIVLQDNRLMQVERGVQVLNGTDPARALACAGLDAGDVELIVYGSCSNEEAVPNSASGVQVAGGTSNHYQLKNNLCSGFASAGSDGGSGGTKVVGDNIV